MINQDKHVFNVYEKDKNPREVAIDSGVVGQTLRKLRIHGPLIPERNEYYDPLSGIFISLNTL